MSKARCGARVWQSGGFRSSQCGNMAKYGDYCGVHSPEKAAERRKKRPPTRFERECAAIKSNREHIEGLEAEVKRLREALAFARSCIKSGESWTDTCEEVFAAALEAK